jgi:hypothetical protein
MKKTVKARFAGFLALAIACCGSLATASLAMAQVQVQVQLPGQSRRDNFSTASYDRMRAWARELDQLASQANRRAQADQAGYRGFRRDSNFLASIRDFSRHVSQFRARMDTYRTRPWNVDDELNQLLPEARNVQRRIERARFVDASTRRDWNHVVDVLNQMLNEYRTAGWNRDGRWGRDGRYGDGRDRRPNAYPDTRGNEGYNDPNAVSRYSTDLRQLAQELDERAARVAQMSDRYGSRYGTSSDLRRFSDEARDFRNAVESRQITQSELRSRVNRLLEEAQTAHAEISRSRVPSDVAADWDGIVQVLNRMRDLVA